MATYKGKLKQKTGSTTSDILYPATDASIVDYSNTIGSTAVTNVKDALDTIVTAGVGVTGVKGNAESNYRTGDVNLTSANIGAVASSGHGNNKVLTTNITDSIQTALSPFINLLYKYKGTIIIIAATTE